MFWDNFKKECDKRGLKPTPVLKECGISTGSIGRWQAGSSPNADAIIAIAKYLQCSTDILLMGSEIMENTLVCVDQCEKDLVMMFREIPAQAREIFFDSIKTSYDKEMSRRETQERLLG